MRLNLYIAQSTGMSRRAADRAIQDGRITINSINASLGQQISETDLVELDGHNVVPAESTVTIMLNKPVGYVCSRDGQGNKTIYDLLPENLHYLKAVGRLDKHSSGLLLMTNDGQLAYESTHPKFGKLKKYKIALDKELTSEDLKKIATQGVTLDDGPSKLQLEAINQQKKEWKVTMSEGRNRQIRRTFETLGYNVVKLHRTHFGSHTLGSLDRGRYKNI